MIDFIRFDYDRSLNLGFQAYIVFGENSERNIKGYLIQAKDARDLREKLRKADGFVGVMSERVEVNRYAVMRKKVEAILDFPERKLDYSTLKLAKEKDVLIEFSLSTILNSGRNKRVRLLEKLRKTLQVVKKLDTPFILTSGAREFYELRKRNQIYEVFSYLGADLARASYWAERLYRKFFDEKYIMDGVERI